MGTGQISKTLSYGRHGAVVYGELSDLSLAFPRLRRIAFEITSVYLSLADSLRWLLDRLAWKGRGTWIRH